MSQRVDKQKGKFAKKFLIVYGYRIYAYNNLNDESTRELYFLKSEAVKVQIDHQNQCMVISVFEADFKEKFYFNPGVGFNTELFIQLDQDGLRMKVAIENNLAYRFLVQSKVKSNRISDLNSKLVSFYQEPTRAKLILEHNGKPYIGLDSSGLGSSFFKSLKIHPELLSLELKSLALSSDSLNFIFDVIDSMKFRLQTLRLESCNIEKSSVGYFIRFLKSPNFVPMKMLSLRGNKVIDSMGEEIFNCLIERVENQ